MSHDAGASLAWLVIRSQMGICAATSDAGYGQDSNREDHKPHLYHYFPIPSLDSTQVQLTPTHVPVPKASPSRCNKVDPLTHLHLVNTLFEDFLSLSASFVLRENALVKRFGQKDRRSQ